MQVEGRSVWPCQINRLGLLEFHTHGHAKCCVIPGPTACLKRCQCVSPCWARWWVGARSTAYLILLYMGKSNTNSRPQNRTSVLTPCSDYPRFIVLRSSDEDVKLSRLSPFKIHDQLKLLNCDPESVRKFRDGSLCVEIQSEVQSKKLLGCKNFCLFDCSSEPHKSLNFSKGAITCWDLRDLENDEILENLQKSGLNFVEVKRIRQKKGQELIDTNAFILTFASVTLPSLIKVAYHRVKVRPYIPNPMRCFSCQKFGHTNKFCNSKPVCAKCASGSHVADNCTSQYFQCINCKGNHPSYSRTCPNWTEEKEILTLKVRNNVTLPEARQAYKSAHSNIASYANVVAANDRQLSEEQQLVKLAAKLGYKILPFDAPHKPELTRSRNRSRSSSSSSAPRSQTTSTQSKRKPIVDSDGFQLVTYRKNGTHGHVNSRHSSLPAKGRTPSLENNPPGPSGATDSPIMEVDPAKLKWGHVPSPTDSPERKSREDKKKRIIHRK